MLIRPIRYDHPDVVGLVARLQQFYVERYGGPDDDPTGVADFTAPAGAFFLGYDADVHVATGAWRLAAEPGAAEIKRMYVVPEARRRGLARQMLAHVESTAAAAGIETLILSTGTRQGEALALYETAGYRRIDGFCHYAGTPLNRCYGKRLTTR